MAKKSTGTRAGTNKKAAAQNARTPAAVEVPAQLSVSELRRAWVRFFSARDHRQLPSASLVPSGDPTLLFTTAGMVQFKPFFAGIEKPPHPRVVTIQKCLRTTDLASVGKTARHLTFFEMLGNFSFGDYFKEGAIRMAWEFSRDVLRFDPQRIHVTIFEDDDEAEKLWHETIGVPKERITRLGRKDNWWGPAGDSGACGPCSELYLDRGSANCTCGNRNCRPGDECERYLEYWNLVFNQFNQKKDGTLQPLPQTGIDTGAGLERIAALLHDRESVYDTDELARLIARTEELTAELGSEGAKVYGKDHSAAFRVIADHIRCVCFAMSDGVAPGNTGRGYVLRRLLRRALMYARELGVRQPILFRLVPLVEEMCGEFYPEVSRAADRIAETVRQEEERFLRTLDHGLRRYDEYLAEHRAQNATVFRGEAAFRLYDTFGFPLEMTVELAEQAGLNVDLDRFEALMQEQRDSGAAAARWKDYQLPANFPATGAVTRFTGYESTTDSGSVVALIQGDTSCDTLTGGPGMLVVDRTCFYAEGGGQLGDTGRIESAAGLFRVTDTRRLGDLFLHIGELVSGTLTIGDAVTLEVDSARRADLMRHHSATHLLNAALRTVLGAHVSQTGSLVAPDYLRFDFAHGQRLTDEELARVEEEVNNAIAEDAPVKTEELPIAEAKERGALATFGEKYGARVRVVAMGNDLSVELCGGTHVPRTGFIQYFHILREGSPGAGNRRIEAVAGEHVVESFRVAFDELGARITDYNEKAQRLRDLSRTEAHPDAQTESLFIRDRPETRARLSRLSDGPGGVCVLSRELEDWRVRLEHQEKELVRLEKRAQAQASEALLDRVADLRGSATQLGGTHVVRASFDDQELSSLRTLGDALKEKERNVVVLFGNRTAKGPVLLFMANKDAVNDGANCGRLIREAAAIVGGGGGGKPETAQAGGKDNARLEEALAHAESLLAAALSAN